MPEKMCGKSSKESCVMNDFLCTTQECVNEVLLHVLARTIGKMRANVFTNNLMVEYMDV